MESVHRGGYFTQIEKQYVLNQSLVSNRHHLAKPGSGIGVSLSPVDLAPCFAGLSALLVVRSTMVIVAFTIDSQ